MGLKKKRMREMELEQGIVHVVCHQCPMCLLCSHSDLAASRKTENWSSAEDSIYLENARSRMATVTRKCPLKTVFDRIPEVKTND